MLFMGILTWEPGKRDEVIQRRSEWKYPEGVKRIGEWSDLAGNRVFSLAEMDDPKAMLAAASAWSDIANLEIVALMETDEVLKLLEAEKAIRREPAD